MSDRVKSILIKYGITAGVPNMTLNWVEESIRFLLSGAVDFEFRTTVADELHDPADFVAIGQWLQSLDGAHKPAKFFLQPYVDRDSVLAAGLHTPAKEKLLAMQEAIAPYTSCAQIRGMD